MRSENKLKKANRIITIILSALISVSLLSGCNETEMPTDETTTSETAETTQKYTDEELDELAQNMPEIVFVLSHHYDDTNILGFFITNTGEIKMFDFRNIAPDEIYEVPDVYDRLEEAVCSEINPSMYYDEEQFEKERITEDELGTVSEEELIEYYKQLLLIDSDADLVDHVPITVVIGDYRVYGITNNYNGEKEFTLLGGYSHDYHSEHSIINAEQLYSELMSLFPELPDYNGSRGY